MRTDPIGLAGGLNLYLYVEGNSINYIDPWGLKKFCTVWRKFSSGWIPTGVKTGVMTRVLPSIEWFELVVPTPYKTLEHYYSEKWKEIVGRIRKCFEVDECGKLHEIDEVDHDDTGKTEWRDVTVGTETVPWNDPRLIPKPPPVIY